MKYYAVIDTNVLVSSMLTSDPTSTVARIVDAIRQDLMVPMFNESILNEYSAVLLRDRFGFNKDKVEDLIFLIKSKGINCERISVAESFADPDDVVFYEVAMSREDSYLVTGNLKHFPKNGRVVSPADMLYIIEYGKRGSCLLCEPEGTDYLPMSLDEINSIIREVRNSLRGVSER